jgi:hypothetical protein
MREELTSLALGKERFFEFRRGMEIPVSYRKMMDEKQEEKNVQK